MCVRNIALYGCGHEEVTIIKCIHPPKPSNFGHLLRRLLHITDKHIVVEHHERTARCPECHEYDLAALPIIEPAPLPVLLPTSNDQAFRRELHQETEQQFASERYLNYLRERFLKMEREKQGLSENLPTATSSSTNIEDNGLEDARILESADLESYLTSWQHADHDISECTDEDFSSFDENLKHLIPAPLNIRKALPPSIAQHLNPQDIMQSMRPASMLAVGNHGISESTSTYEMRRDENLANQNTSTILRTAYEAIKETEEENEG